MSPNTKPISPRPDGLLAYKRAIEIRFYPEYRCTGRTSQYGVEISCKGNKNSPLRGDTFASAISRVAEKRFDILNVFLNGELHAEVFYEARKKISLALEVK